VAIGIGLCVAGCGKQNPNELAAATIANEELSDAQAIEELAEQMFERRDVVSVEELDGGEISLSVTIHPSRDAEVIELQGGPGAVAVDSGYVLGISVFSGRRMVKYGRQRGLARLLM
jgi:hypothetical protein